MTGHDDEGLRTRKKGQNAKGDKYKESNRQEKKVEQQHKELHKHSITWHLLMNVRDVVGGGDPVSFRSISYQVNESEEDWQKWMRRKRRHDDDSRTSAWTGLQKP